MRDLLRIPSDLSVFEYSIQDSISLASPCIGVGWLRADVVGHVLQDVVVLDQIEPHGLAALLLVAARLEHLVAQTDDAVGPDAQAADVGSVVALDRGQLVTADDEQRARPLVRDAVPVVVDDTPLELLHVDEHPAVAGDRQLDVALDEVRVARRAGAVGAADREPVERLLLRVVPAGQRRRDGQRRVGRIGDRRRILRRGSRRIGRARRVGRVARRIGGRRRIGRIARRVGRVGARVRILVLAALHQPGDHLGDAVRVPAAVREVLPQDGAPVALVLGHAERQLHLDLDLVLVLVDDDHGLADVDLVVDVDLEVNLVARVGVRPGHGLVHVLVRDGANVVPVLRLGVAAFGGLLLVLPGVAARRGHVAADLGAATFGGDVAGDLGRAAGAAGPARGVAVVARLGAGVTGLRVDRRVVDDPAAGVVVVVIVGLLALVLLLGLLLLVLVFVVVAVALVRLPRLVLAAHEAVAVAIAQGDAAVVVLHRLEAVEVRAVVAAAGEDVGQAETVLRVEGAHEGFGELELVVAQLVDHRHLAGREQRDEEQGQHEAGEAVQGEHGRLLLAAERLVGAVAPAGGEQVEQADRRAHDAPPCGVGLVACL